MAVFHGSGIQTHGVQTLRVRRTSFFRHGMLSKGQPYATAGLMELVHAALALTMRRC